MSVQLLRKSLANVLQQEFIRLCAEAISFEQELDIVGIVSVTVDSEPNEIVVKVNRKLHRTDRDALSLSTSPNATAQSAVGYTQNDNEASKPATNSSVQRPGAASISAVNSTQSSHLLANTNANPAANAPLSSPPCPSTSGCDRMKRESVSPLSIATINSAMQRSLALPFAGAPLNQFAQMQLIMSAAANHGIHAAAAPSDTPLEQSTSNNHSVLLGRYPTSSTNATAQSSANEKPVGAQKRKRQAARLPTLRNKAPAFGNDSSPSTNANANDEYESHSTEPRRLNEPGGAWSAEALDLTTGSHPTIGDGHEPEAASRSPMADRSDAIGISTPWSASDDEHIDVENGDVETESAERPPEMAAVSSTASAQQAGPRASTSNTASVTTAIDKSSGLLAGSNPDAAGFFSCSLCPARFEQATLLGTHYDEQHKQIACVYCGKSFSTRQNLRRHERLHTGQKPYVCSVCEMYFYRRDALMTHMGRAHAVIDVAIYRHRNEQGRIATIRLNDTQHSTEGHAAPTPTPPVADSKVPAEAFRFGTPANGGAPIGALPNVEVDLARARATDAPCLQCTVCTGTDAQTTYASRDAFANHLRIVHRITEMRFCDVCSLVFESQRTFELHERSEAHRVRLLTGAGGPSVGVRPANGEPSDSGAQRRAGRKLRLRPSEADEQQ